MPRLHESYLRSVFSFLHDNGPFSMVEVRDGEPRKCDCCSQSGLRRHFLIESRNGNVFTVGLECQEYLLDINEAVLPAKSVRRLGTNELVQLAQRYEVDCPSPVDKPSIIQEILSARRKFAAKIAWEKRRAA